MSRLKPRLTNISDFFLRLFSLPGFTAVRKLQLKIKSGRLKSLCGNFGIFVGRGFSCFVS